MLRLFSEGIVTDFDQFKKIADTLSQHTAAVEPDAGYEVFTDEPSGRAAFLETWPSERAFLGHVGWMVESKVVEQLLACYSPDRISALDPVTDPQVAVVVRQFGVLELERISALGAPDGVAGT
jgi:quinol monooxygenase YgiN